MSGTMKRLPTPFPSLMIKCRLRGLRKRSQTSKRLIGVLFFAILLSFNTAVAGSGTDEPILADTKRLGFEVDYDHPSNRLSIHAHQIPLDKILEEISKKSHLAIDAANEELLKERISTELKGLPLDQGVYKLFEDYNAAFFFSSPIEDAKSGTPHLVKVFLLSKKARVHVEASGTKQDVAVRDKLVTESTPGAKNFEELLLAVHKHDLLRVTQIAKSLKEVGKEDAMEAAVSSLIENLKAKDFQSYESTMAALKELAPGAAVSILANWLTEDNRQLQVSAASGLGQLGDKSGIDILISALNSADPSVRQAAASSLARIGGEKATNVLFQTYLAGDDSTKNAVAVAVLSHGNENLQTTLMNLSTGLQRPGNFLTPRPAPPVRYNQSQQ